MEKIICPLCKKEYETIQMNCSGCGYPFTATEKEKSVFIAQQIIKKNSIKDTKDRVKTVRIMLWFLGQLFIINLISDLIHNDIDLFNILGLLIMGLFFLFCGFLSYKYPLHSILLPLIILTVFHLTTILLLDVSTFLHLLLPKIVIHVFLIIGLIFVIKAEKLKKESLFLSNQKFNTQ